MKNIRYRMSFTTGGLFLTESVQIAELFLQLRDWTLVKEKVFQDNLLQARKISTAKKQYSEIVPRLKLLEKTEIEYFVNCSVIDQSYLLWVAVCRRYEFVRDFAIEVLREYYLTHKKHIQNEDFELFFEDKSEWHSELEQIKPSTRQKLRQVLFRMMQDANLISSKKLIISALLSNELLTLLSQNDYRDLKVFPVFDSVIGGRVI